MSVRLSVSHTRDPRLTVQDIEICFTPNDRVMFSLLLSWVHPNEVLKQGIAH